MKIGIHAFRHDSHTEAGVQRARYVGAEAVCLGVSHLPGVAEHGAPDADALRAAVDRYRNAGIAAAAGHAARWSDEMMLGDPARAEEFMLLRATLERMAAAGIESVLFYTTPPLPENPAEAEAAFKGFVAFCRALGDLLDDIGINIACHPWVSRPALLHGYRRLHQMCQQVDSPRMGITYCPGGALAGDDMRQVRESFRGRIHFAHLRDQVGDWRSFTEVFPGTGDTDTPELVRGLRDSGYTGLLCPEHLGAAAPDRDLEAEAVCYAKSIRNGS